MDLLIGALNDLKGNWHPCSWDFRRILQVSEIDKDLVNTRLNGLINKKTQHQRD